MKDYSCLHDVGQGFAAGEKYCPDEMDSKLYYHPVDRGLESRIAEKLNYLRNLNRNRRES
jgi:putative ATPase